MASERRGVRPVVGPTAPRVLVEAPPRGLPLAVSAAVTEFLTGPLLDNPHRVGKPLTRELGGYHSARRGAYRVIYRIDETERVVHVVRIDHRADVYRARSAGSFPTRAPPATPHTAFRLLPDPRDQPPGQTVATPGWSVAPEQHWRQCVRADRRHLQHDDAELKRFLDRLARLRGPGRNRH